MNSYMPNAPKDLALNRAFAVGIASLLVVLGCDSRTNSDNRTSVSRQEQVTPHLALAAPASASNRPEPDSAFVMTVNNDFTILPGIWVSDAKFLDQDIQDPQILGETVSEDGVRVRSWYHKSDGFEWVSTNQGMISPDGPFWISQVESSKLGASLGGKYSVGQSLGSVSGDSDLVAQNNSIGRTVQVRKGMIVKLILTSSTPPAP
jgi:hypothetical protein